MFDQTPWRQMLVCVTIPAMATLLCRGDTLLFGRVQCSTCKPAPYYTDNLMHNLRAERFHDWITVNSI